MKEAYFMYGPELVLTLPGWVQDYIQRNNRVFSGDDEKMHIAVELSRINIAHGGGPFGAAIFNSESGRLIAPGVNLVESLGTSIAHAEMVAILGAQLALGSYDLGGESMPPCELFSSTEPCAMCLGAIPWSGIRRLVCGARDADARSIGFDEGSKPEDWIGSLESRRISVVTGVLRAEARAVLQDYSQNGGTIYNAHGD